MKSKKFYLFLLTVLYAIWGYGSIPGLDGKWFENNDLVLQFDNDTYRSPGEDEGIGKDNNSMLSEVAGWGENLHVNGIEVLAAPAFMEAPLAPPPPDNVSNGSIGGLLDDERELVATGRAVIAKIREAGNFITTLTGGNLKEFPVGLSKTIGNVEYTMGINSMKLFPTYAQLEVFLEIKGPNMEQPLIFFSPDVKFSSNGGIVGGATLGLLGNMTIDIVEEKSVLLLKRAIRNPEGEFTGGTYVTISCDGFEELSVDLEVHFSRDWIKPADAEDKKRIIGSFAAQVGGLHDLLFEIDINKPFVINKLEDVEWRVDNMVFDFSELRHSTAFNFPLNIQEDQYQPLVSDDRWKGFYVSEVEVVLPKRLTGENEITINGQHLVIDENGFTGIASASSTPLLGINQGNLNGWAFSVNYFEVVFLAGDLKEVYFDGKIGLPLFNAEGADPDANFTEADALSYTASLNLGNYYGFTISNDTPLAINAWKARATLLPNTQISLEYEENTFTARADIYADIEIDGEIGANARIEVPAMRVEGMVLSNQAPYFEPGNWAFPTEIDANIGSFNLSITDPSVINTEEDGIPEAGLDFEASLTLDGPLAIEAEGGFLITGELDQSEAHHKWKPKKFQVKSLHVEGSFAGANSLVADIHFYDGTDPAIDPVYGTGFRGMGQIDFKGVGIGIGAIAQFGTSGQGDAAYKYFFVDVLAEFPPGMIPLGGMDIRGLGGGIYRHMSRPNADEAFSQLLGGDESEFGASLSGVVYTPIESVSLGFKASVMLATPSTGTGNAFNANVSLGMEFGPTEGNPDGNGLQRLWFQGSGRFMASPNPELAPAFPAEIDVAEIDFAQLEPHQNPFGAVTAPNLSSDVSAYVLIDFNFNEDVYDARAKVFWNVNGGKFAGEAWCAFHLEVNEGAENKWWFFVGTPESKARFEFQFLGQDALVEAYFMMGNEGIPGIPPPFDPFNPGQPLEDGEVSYPTDRPANTNLLMDSGQGFAFGAGLHVGLGIGNENSLFFALLQGGIGFDISILKQNGTCVQDLDIGVNGWYSKGQAWAYLDASVGVNVKLFGKKLSLVVLDALIAASVQMELMNPTWGKGAVVVQVSVLNGLIDINDQFEFEFGDPLNSVLPADCDPANGDDLVQDIEVIEAIRLPEGQNLNDVDVGSSILVDLNIPDQEILTFFNEEVEPEYFRVIFEGVNFQDDNGDPISLGVIDPDLTSWDETNKHLTLTYINFFPENTTITANAVARFQQRSTLPDGTYAWGYVDGDDGEPLEHIKTITFTTGGRPDVITLDNVIVSYPIPNQQYFFKDQYDGGYYIDLHANQMYLFQNLPEGYEAKGRLLGSNGQQLGNLLNVEANTYWNEETIDNSVYGDPEEVHNTFVTIERSWSIQSGADQTLELVVLKTDANAQVDPVYGEERLLYAIPFHTSNYANLEYKINGFYNASSNYVDADGDAYSQDDVLQALMNTSETFDQFDLEGGSNFRPLISFEVEIEDQPTGSGFDCVAPAWLCYYEHVYQAVKAYGDCISFGLDDPRKAISISNQVEGSSLQLNFEFPAAIYDYSLAVYERLQNSECCGTGECNGYDPPDDPDGNPDGESGSGDGSGGGGPNAFFIFSPESAIPVESIAGPDDGSCNPAYAEGFCEGIINFPADLLEDNYHINVKYILPRRNIQLPSQGRITIYGGGL